MTGLTPLEGDQAQDDGRLQGEGALQGECLPHPGTEEADPLWGGKVPFLWDSWKCYTLKAEGEH